LDKALRFLAAILLFAQIMQQPVVNTPAPSGGFTPIGLVAHAAAAGSGTLTSAIDTTGASLLTLVAVAYNVNTCLAASPVDSKSNTWVALTNYAAGGGASICIWYVANPTVGTGHTVSYSSTFASVGFAAWSNVVTTSPSDVNTGATSTALSLNTGAVTPTANNELCFAGGTEFTTPAESSFAFPSPLQTFTVLDTEPSSGSGNMGLADGYFVQTTAASISTTYTIVSSEGAAPLAVALACFKHA
jgi:hypothetical protein